MANRRPQNPRRPDFGRNDRPKNFGRSGLSPWQGGGPGGGLPNLLPLTGSSTEATLALASNLINLLQPRQNVVPSLLDMPIQRNFAPNMNRFDRGYNDNRMGNQNFRRTGNYNRAGERINNNRKPFRPHDGQRHQNKSPPKKEADSKAKPVKESPEEQKDEKTEDGEEKKKETPKTRYDDINSQLLKCHICNKSMWDGRSFENHLSGRAHAIMMQKTAESYALTADTMRQEFKIRDMKRSRKSGQQPARDFYCAMCDMYAADGAVHRTTVGHRKLKKYLHPICISCRKEMPTRIELDEHRLTPEHLKMQDKAELVSKPQPEVMVISTLSMEQSYLREDRQRRRKPKGGEEVKVKQETETEVEGGEKEIKVEPKEEHKEEPKEDEKEDKLDNEDTILDYKEGDDLTGVTKNRYPYYSTERGVGSSFLEDFRCVQCNLCHKLLDSDETAQVHLRTWRHHQLFLRMLAEKTPQPEKEQEETQESEKKRSMNSEESGNWKRRKTSPDDGFNQNGHDEDVVMKEEPQSEADNIEKIEDDTQMPSSDQLEDWDQSVDDIQQDEQTNEDKNLEQEEIQEETPAPEPETVKVTPINNPKPRGRGRGRGRKN